jgi:hypothetical protein
MARTLLGVTFNRFAASAVLMSFTAKVYHSGETVLPRNNFFDKRRSRVYSGAHKTERAGKCD